MLAFGDELLVQQDDEYEWRTPGGRELAAAYLLPLAETALRPRCSGWPTRLVAVPGQRRDLATAMPLLPAGAAAATALMLAAARIT
jgi:hypothetical protein